MGYIELWNGNVQGFGDEALSSLGSGQTLAWTERVRILADLALPLSASVESQARDWAL